jgi:SWI/SNF-related matrix-associated actin-dependent regulator 1 of chromatin subfamily A
MSRPKELFTQLHAIEPTYFSNPWKFVERYCDPKRTFNNAVDDSGASCVSELQWVMERVAMIRRTKKDVLSDLPEKIRETVWLEVTNESKQRVSHLKHCGD